MRIFIETLPFEYRVANEELLDSVMVPTLQGSL